MKVLGLTGNIASGKSVVASMLSELGARVIDVDDIARTVVEPGEDAWGEIVDEFGRQVLNPDDTINREKLGDIIFNDSNKRKTLNDITHPRIIDKVRESVEMYRQENIDVVIIEAALIVEKGGLKDLIEALIVVTSDKESQIDRLARRDGLSEEQALSRIRSQMPASEKERHADYLIDNSGTLSDTRNQVYDIWQQIRT